MDALRRGEADLIPNLGITPARSNDFDFTAPLETFALGLFVRSVNSDIHGMDDLAGKTVAVVKRNAAVKWLGNYPQVDSRLYETQEQALFALLSGEVDAFVYPITVTWKMASEIGVDGRIRQAGLPLLEIKRAVAVRKGNQALLNRLDHAVRAYTHSKYFGESYARLHARPKPFWNLERVIRYGSSIVAILLALIVLVLFWWYRSIRKLNQQLQESHTELARSSRQIEELKEQLELASQQRAVTSGSAVEPDSDPLERDSSAKKRE